jgi:hypothetical protein
MVEIVASPSLVSTERFQPCSGFLHAVQWPNLRLSEGSARGLSVMDVPVRSLCSDCHVCIMPGRAEPHHLSSGAVWQLQSSDGRGTKGGHTPRLRIGDLKSRSLAAYDGFRIMQSELQATATFNLQKKQKHAEVCRSMQQHTRRRRQPWEKPMLVSGSIHATKPLFQKS